MFEILQVSNYVSNNFVCYRFILKASMERYDAAMISFDPINPFIVSLIAFNESLYNNVTEFIAFYNSKDSLPTEELIQATGLDRFLQSDNQAMYNNFGIRYRMDKIQNVEPPYTTVCRNANQREQYLK